MTKTKEIKEKTIEKARKDAENDYQGGGAYRAFLEMFYKNKKEEDAKQKHESNDTGKREE